MWPVIREKGVFRKLIILTALCLDFERTFSDYIIVEFDCSIFYAYHRI